MKIINCPVNGPRPMQEFAYGGEVRSIPDSDKAMSATESCGVISSCAV